jgi:MSHA type pilus biogenesis protein MshL
MACAHSQQAPVAEKEEQVDFIKTEANADDPFKDIITAPIPEPETPEFIPVKEESSPLSTKTVSIATRKTDLRDVLFTIAQTANLNLVLQRGVDPELPVTMTFSNLTVANALDIIFDSVDYFYTIKDNILIVSAMDTRIYEIGQPNIVQDYKINVGGDILSGTSSGGEGQTAVSGDVSLQSATDKEAFEFWNAIEASMKTLVSSENKKKKQTQSSFVMNRMAGTIMVTATRKELERVGKYINNLKKVFSRQVLIEARIIEVQLSEGQQYGIDWSNVISGLDIGNITHGTSKTLAPIGGAFRNVVDSTGPRYLINITGNDNFSFLLNALEENGNVKTLSNPRVNIMNGQTSLLSVGRNTSFISKVETTTSTEGTAQVRTFTVETSSILSGIMFGLVPYISKEGEITITITPIVTNLVELESKLIGGTEDSSAVEIKLPTVDLREMSTTVKVMDGQMIIIGGLIDKKEIIRENKIPLLGDIPILGHAFRSVTKTEEKTELVIILMPKLVS